MILELIAAVYTGQAFGFEQCQQRIANTDANYRFGEYMRLPRKSTTPNTLLSRIDRAGAAALSAIAAWSIWMSVAPMV